MRAVHQHAAGAADRLRTFARAGAVGGADVERDAGDHEGSVAIMAGDAQETGWRGKCRRTRHTEAPAKDAPL